VSPALPPRRPLQRRRLRLPRRPAPFWVLTVALALLTGLVVSSLLDATAAGVARYGEPVPAVVVLRPVRAGSPVGSDATAVRLRPAELVPEGARTTPAAGEVALVDLHPGEVVLEARLAPAGLSPAAALLPPGTRGLSVPTGPGALALRPGDRVDVLATLEPGLAEASGSPAGPPTVTVARRATVVVAEETGDAVTVAVTTGEAPRVAFALSAGTVTLLLVGPDG
jgi:Flp pilus assembly protein CpaB